MKPAVLALGAALALAGCQQRPDLTATPDTVLRACQAVTLGYLIWEATYAPKAKHSTATKIRAGYASVAAVCANPPSTSAETLAAALRAVQAYNAELATAKAGS